MNINLNFNSGEQADTAFTTYRGSKMSEISGNVYILFYIYIREYTLVDAFVLGLTV